jgi:hypothetical protein
VNYNNCRSTRVKSTSVRGDSVVRKTVPPIAQSIAGRGSRARPGRSPRALIFHSTKSALIDIIIDQEVENVGLGCRMWVVEHAIVLCKHVGLVRAKRFKAIHVSRGVPPHPHASKHANTHTHAHTHTHTHTQHTTHAPL